MATQVKARAMRSFEAEPDVEEMLRKLQSQHTKLKPHINESLRRYFREKFGWGWRKKGKAAA